ncbi:MAG: galactitol-1-phosphate 5-dehydrogenase [Lachnospiraceae bacterium]|nr:galactitol-1-phosphate 5-dehydrogenase [Lachnospiraceae bacterium]
MKAYVLNDINKLDFMEVPKPDLQEGEVLVEIKAAGICGSDIPRIFETGTYHFPTIPGHEFAGVVREVKDEQYRKWIGKRVGVFPLIPCMNCQPCKEKKYEMCMNYDYLGSRRDGGFAEYVAVPVRNLIELPENVSFEAAAMLEPCCVGIHALRQVDMNRIHTAVIFGPGTIGLLMAQWLRVLGVKDIYIVGTNEGQRRLAAELGFMYFYNCKEVDEVQCLLELTDNNGIDLAIECTGFSSVLEKCLEIVKRGGDVLTVGNPHGDVHLPKAVYWKLLRKQLRISGTWNSSFVPEDAGDDWKTALEAISTQKLLLEKQITHKLSFEKLQQGLEIMRDKTEYYNKVMIVR